jgi:hypothetical protein
VKSREARNRDAWRLIAWGTVAVAALLVPWAAVEASMDGQTVAAFLQAAILLGTAGIVWWYAKETRRLRETAQQQVAETQRQIEVQQRPFVIIEPHWYRGSLIRLVVQNIGNSAAVKIRVIIRETSTIAIPALSHDANVVVRVSTDRNVIDQALKIQALTRIEGVVRDDDLDFFIDAESFAHGFRLNIEYQNLAMHPYETREEILPDGDGYNIHYSGKRVPSTAGCVP